MKLHNTLLMLKLTTVTLMGFTSTVLAEVTKKEVLQHFAHLAYTMYTDSLLASKSLQASVNDFLQTPTPTKLERIKASYTTLRITYPQSEILRFDNENGHISLGLDKDGGPSSVDDWEGQVNAWPLDEALVDYVEAGYQGQYKKGINIINSKTNLFAIGGDQVNISQLTPEVLTQLNEIGGSKANVTTGIHAIEFLIWGQDTRGSKPGAGKRPISDYYTHSKMGKCTSGKQTHNGYRVCKRRAQYLKAIVSLLIKDFKIMVTEWSPTAQKKPCTLSYDFLHRGSGLIRILDAISDMAAAELASERLKIPILFGSTEDELDCFSDLTHLALENNARGIVNAYTGTYVKLNGENIAGASLSDLVGTINPDLNQRILTHLNQIMDAMKKISAQAQVGKRFDQIIEGSKQDQLLILNAAKALSALNIPLTQEVAPIFYLTRSQPKKNTCPG